MYSKYRKSDLRGGKTKFLNFFFFIGISATKIWEKLRISRYGLPEDFLGRGQKITEKQNVGCFRVCKDVIGYFFIRPSTKNDPFGILTKAPIQKSNFHSQTLNFFETKTVKCILEQIVQVKYQFFLVSLSYVLKLIVFDFVDNQL